MKIVAVSVLEYRRPLDGRAWNPSFRWTERRAPLLVIEAESGLAGIGEAWCRQQDIEAILAHLAGVVAPALIGREFDADESIAALTGPLRTLSPDTGRPWVAPAAAGAADIALWDLAARARRQPLWQALGGAAGRVRVYASGGLYRDGSSVADLATEMRGYVEAGFRAVKMKVGALPLEEDLARVRAVRAAVGADVELWVDAVNQLTPETALPWARALATAGAGVLQAPVPFSDLATMARINAECLPVAAGEAEHDAAAFHSLLAADAVTLLQPNLGLCGGLFAATSIAEDAREHLVDVSPQTFGTVVLQAAALHWGAATAGVTSVEVHRFHDHLAALAGPALSRPVDGCIALDDAPGLGVRIPLPGPQADGGTLRCYRRLDAHP